MIERGKYYKVYPETTGAIRSGRTKVYALLAQKKLVAVKSGRTTLITGDSILDYLENLPRPEFRTGLGNAA